MQTFELTERSARWHHKAAIGDESGNADERMEIGADSKERIGCLNASSASEYATTVPSNRHAGKIGCTEFAFRIGDDRPTSFRRTRSGFKADSAILQPIPHVEATAASKCSPSTVVAPLDAISRCSEPTNWAREIDPRSCMMPRARTLTDSVSASRGPTISR